MGLTEISSIPRFEFLSWVHSVGSSRLPEAYIGQISVLMKIIKYRKSYYTFIAVYFLYTRFLNCILKIRFHNYN